jgi:hypothetical protein
MYTKLFFGCSLGLLKDLKVKLFELAIKVDSSDRPSFIPESVDDWIQLIDYITYYLPDGLYLDVSGKLRMETLEVHLNMVDSEEMNLVDFHSTNLFEYAYILGILEVKKTPTVYSKACYN